MDPTPSKRRKLVHSGASSAITLSGGGSAFVLETEELLREVRVDYDTVFSDADKFLRKIKDSIERIEPHEPRPIISASTTLSQTQHIRVPFPDPPPPKDSNYKVAFAPPAQCNVVGSFVGRTMVRAQMEAEKKTSTDPRNHDKPPTIDMIVIMPPAILQEKDYLDLRYFYKRAYYLAVVAGALRGEFGDECDYEFCWENPLAPVLSLRPKKGLVKEGEGEEEDEEGDVGFRVRIIPCAPEGFFPQQKLHPGAALIRKVGEDGKDGKDRKDGKDAAAAAPTPFYNSTLKAEGLFLAYLRLLRKTETSCSAFREACMLGRMWLIQRGFEGTTGFGHFEWATLLALLLRTNDKRGQAALSSSLTAVQLFRAVIRFLSVTNFAKKPCVLGGDDSAKTTIESLALSTKDGPILYDGAREMNVAFKMSTGAALMLHLYAKWTHSLLSESVADQFSPTFILRSDVPLLNWDAVAELKCDAVLDKAKKNTSASRSCRGPLGDLGDKVYSLLKRAFGDKARLIHVSAPAVPPSSLSGKSTSKSQSQSHTLRIGVLFGPDMARRIDRGPSVEEKKEAARFLQFWGDKSELRRFEDGETRETLIWQSTTPEDICEEVTRYVLQKHLRLGHLHGELEFRGKGFAPLVPVLPTDANLFSIARKEFAAFEQDVRGLGDDFPLQVRRLLPICPELRHASVHPPSFDTSAGRQGPQPMDAVIYFEASGKWPDNLAAVQRLKIALLLKLGSLLEAAKGEGKVKTHLGLEDARPEETKTTITTTEMGTTETGGNLAFLDLVYASGAAFRLRIHSDLEETLLERARDNKTLEPRVRAESATRLATFRRLYAHLPLHTQTVATHATRFPALSPTIRLLASWFGAHKLSAHFLPEFVELVALRVFLAPWPWDPPSSPRTGFLRALLFLARWDWRAEPLFVDTSSTDGDTTTTSADRTALDTRLAAFRRLDPNMNTTVLVAATTAAATGGGGSDRSGTAYTSLNGEPKPPKVVAARMTALARSATKLVRESGASSSASTASGEPESLDPKALFTPALRDYDVLIYLNKKVVRSLLRIYPTDDNEDSSNEDDGDDRHTRFKNLDTRTGQAPLPLAQHPIHAFLHQLEAVYAAAAGGPLVFFYGSPDSSNGNIIGAVWNPQAQRRNFRARMPASYRPVVDLSAGGAKVRRGKNSNDESSGDEEEEEEEEEDEEEEVVVELNREAILAEIARIGGELVERIECREEY